MATEHWKGKWNTKGKVMEEGKGKWKGNCQGKGIIRQTLEGDDVSCTDSLPFQAEMNHGHLDTES